MVAWTGEIETPRSSSPRHAACDNRPSSSLNVLSAPIPIDGDNPPPTPPLVDGLWIPREDMDRLQYQLSHDSKIKTVPVWLADEPDGHERRHPAEGSVQMEALRRA